MARRTRSSFGPMLALLADRAALAQELRRALRAGPARGAMVIAGVAACTLLVLVQIAAYRNVVGSVRGYVDQGDIDLWVAPRGTDNLVRSSGVIDAESVEALKAVPGIASAHRILRFFVSVAGGPTKGRRPLNQLGIGYASPGGLGGPPRFSAGRAPRGVKEVALDRAAARRLGVGIGDHVQVNGRPSRVVGLTAGTNLLATQFIFCDIQAAEEAAGMWGDASFVALRLAPGASGAEVRRRVLRKVEEVSVHGRAEFVENSVQEAASGFLPMLALITLLGVAVAAVLVALLMQGAVEDRRTDIAVMLALGARPSRVASALVAQATRRVALGSGCGAVLALGLALELHRRCSVIELAQRGGDVALILGFFLAAGVLAALAPLWRLSRVDPQEAFRR